MGSSSSGGAKFVQSHQGCPFLSLSVRPLAQQEEGLSNGFEATVKKKRKSYDRWRRRIMIWSIFMTIIPIGFFGHILHLMKLSPFYYDSKQNKNKPRNLQNVQAAMPLCTFEQLQKSFTLPAKETQNNKENDTNRQQQGNSTCWSLKDRIFRVPVTAIMNRDFMTILGKGRKGTVYEVIIRLMKSQRDDNDRSGRNATSTRLHPLGEDQSSSASTTRYCVAALKTDQCFDQETGRHIPCVHSGLRGPDGKILVPRPKFNLMGEYTGALAWYYAQQQQIMEANETYPKGLLPAWGLVVAPSNNSTMTTTTTEQEQPIEDDSSSSSSIPLGVLMPLQSMTITLDGYIERQGERTMQPRRVAKLMLSAAQGLAFLADMDLVHQDVRAKNIAIVVEDKRGKRSAPRHRSQRSSFNKKNSNNNPSNSNSRVLHLDSDQVQYLPEDTEEYSILYDNTFTSFLPNEEGGVLSTKKKNKNKNKNPDYATTTNRTSFCIEHNEFVRPPREDKYMHKNALNPFESDVLYFRDVVLQLLDNKTTPEGRMFYQSLLVCRSARQLVRVLQHYAAPGLSS
ncbi:hypothetical protein ACA910_007224 [Epithemia clementina (nom. ined.)]